MMHPGCCCCCCCCVLQILLQLCADDVLPSCVVLWQMIVRRYSATKEVPTARFVDYHYDSSSISAVVSLHSADFEVDRSGDLVADYNQSPGGTPKEVHAHLQPGDVALLDHACMHRTTACERGSRWTIVVFYGFA